MDESTNHHNQETHNEVAKDKTKGVTEFKLETPKVKTDLFADHSEFMRQMDDRLQNKINEIQNINPTERAIRRPRKCPDHLSLEGSGSTEAKEIPYATDERV